MKPRRHIHPMRVIMIATAAAVASMCLWAQDSEPRRTRRHTTPITSAATTTQAINETREDTSRINAAFRARSTHFHRDDGAIVYVDTITGEEWIDSTTIVSQPKMKYPLLVDATVGVDVWDPVMRIFGQAYGLTTFTFDVNLHNRYFPVLEVGLGNASSTPSDKNFHYVSPTSVYFKIGANYNFIYNNNPAYKFFAGVRYGFAPFKWGLESATPAAGYWGDVPPFDIPNMSATAGWFEFCLGLRVKLWKNISAGWMFKYHVILHETKSVHGEPWYIPGYGTRGQAIAGSFTISYTIPFKEKPVPILEPAPSSDDTPTPDYLPEIRTTPIKPVSVPDSVHPHNTDTIASADHYSAPASE